jgi:hypothetical protein
VLPGAFAAFNQRKELKMLSTKFNTKALAIAVAATAAYVIATIFPVAVAAAPALQAGCSLNAAKVKVSKTEQTTTTGADATVIDGSIAFVQGGKSPNCIIVSLSGEAKADANTAMFVDALVDGALCEPTPSFFVRSNATATDFADRAMNYLCTGVAPGAHRTSLKFHTDINGNAVTLGWRTVIVHYFQ